MRILLALLFTCLLGCMAMPPTTGGVFHHGSCPVYWRPQDFPLHVVADRRLTTVRRAALEEAIVRWNVAAGAEVFSLDREIDWFDLELLDPEQGTVYVLVMDLPDNPTTGSITQGWASLSYDGCRIIHVLTFLDVAVPDQDAMLVFEHELGHSLGLAHDDNESSIMWYYANSSGGQIMADDLFYIRWELTHGNPRNPSLPEPEAFDGGRPR